MRECLRSRAAGICSCREQHQAVIRTPTREARRRLTVGERASSCFSAPPDRDTTQLRGPMSQPRPTDPIGSITWTERTGGVLTARECLTLARPLLRGELSILAGRLAMVLRMHSGRRRSIDPASLVPPDSALARHAEVAAQDLLTPALLNHSSRAYTWGAAIAALQGIRFDRELLYLAAMFHDPRRRPRIRCRGLPPIRRRSRRCVRPTQQRDTRCSPPERHPAVPAGGL
jgi:hypothetical protein